MKRIYLYLIIIVACIISSCNLEGRGKSVLPIELVQAENIMYENPDSALHILQAMPIPTEKEAHATWALFLTQARYKCDVKQSDSLLNIAYDYFMEGDNAQRKALVLYHKGVFPNEKNQVDSALPYYLQASEFVENSNDFKLSYLIYNHIGTIYRFRNLENYTLDYYEKANKAALLSQDSYYINDSYINLARVNAMQKKYENAIKFYIMVIELAKENNDQKNLVIALTELAGVHLREKNYSKAIHNLYDALRITPSDQIHYILGHAYYRINETDSAYYYLNKAINAESIYTIRSAYQILCNLSKKTGDYKKNSEYTVKLWKVQDSISRMDRNKTLIEMQEKYNQQMIINEKNELERKGLIVLCIAIFMIGIIIVFYQQRVYQQKKELDKKMDELNKVIVKLNKNEEIIAKNEERIRNLNIQQEHEKEITIEQQKEYLQTIRDMENQNDLLEKENNELKHKIEQYTTTMIEKVKEVQGLRSLSEKNLYLHKRELFLCNELLKKEEFIKKLKKTPKSLDLLQWKELIDKTNAIFDNYTVRLRTQIPELTENDIRICCLIKLSFGNGNIADILGISPTSVSRQKLRLKERIIQQIGPFEKNLTLDIWLREF